MRRAFPFWSLLPLVAMTVVTAQDVVFSGGGRLREQFEFFQNREFGELRPRRDAYLLHRLQLRGEVHVGDELHGLVELVNALAIGQDTPLAPIDEDQLDFLRGQVDWTPDLGGTEFRIRLGRQELMLGRGRLMSTREGPNLRLAFDGARVTWTDGAEEDEEGGSVRLDAFALSPVGLERGVFDDEFTQGELLYGGQLAVDWFEVEDASLLTEFYYLGRSRENARTATVAGSEDRHTLGVHLVGSRGGWSVDGETMVQFGNIGGESIRAYAASGILEHEFDSLPWSPRPGLHLDVISGDRDAGDGRSETFDPLYPNNSYFNDAAAFVPSNLYSVSGTFGIRPHDDVSVDVMWDFSWRFSRQDSVYIPPGVPLFDPEESDSRFIGHSLTVAGEWGIREDLAFNVAFSHIDAGPAITDSGGRDLTYFATWINWWF